MNKIYEWWLQYRTEATWWVIGWISFNVLDCITKGFYAMAVFNAALIYINYWLWKKR